MAAFNKFNFFVQDLAQKVHNLATDQITVALCSVAPVATNHILSDITQISYTNLSARNVTTTSCVQTSGTLNFILADLVLTASGAVAGFRYVVLYNSTAASGNLIGWYDYGSTLTLANTETFTIDLDNVTGLLTIV
jgi:hypothetical protein